jgi:hypothetical protein
MVDRTLLYLVRVCAAAPRSVDDVNRQLAAEGAVDVAMKHQGVPRALSALVDARWLTADYTKSRPTYHAGLEQLEAAEEEPALGADVRESYIRGPAPRLPRCLGGLWRGRF